MVGDFIKKHKFGIEMTIVVICCTISIMYVYGMRGQIEELQEYRTKVLENYTELQELTNTAAEIKALYETYSIVDDIDFDKCVDMALTYFTAAIHDKYGAYLTPEENIELTNKREESIMGIGVQIVYEKGTGDYVSIVYKDSPAERAGIQVGDYLTYVNGHYIEDVGNDTFASMIRGKVGTTVEIGYTRNNELFTVEVTRGAVASESVRPQVIDNTVYMKIDSFTFHTNTEFKNTMTEYKNKGYENFIIDLRNNTGGILETVVDMLDYLVPKGLILRAEGKAEESNIEYYSDSSEFNGNIVVLVNRYSASASELFAQTLKDYDKAIIVGERTFGKGTVVSEYQLEFGGSVILSTAMYYTMSGASVEKVGVTPDIEVALTEDQFKINYKLPLSEDPQFQMAMIQFDKG